MNGRMIQLVIGRILCVEGAFMTPALLISLYCQEWEESAAFAVSMAALAAAGIPLSRRKLRHRGFYAREGLITVGVAWILVSFFGALPFFFSGAIPHFIDAFFETVSGFTTTGATILGEIESLPRGILYWRSFTHWLGGMGVLVFVLATGPLSKENGPSIHILRAESTGVKIDKLVPRMQHSAKILYQIYIVLTIIQIIFLLFGGVSLYEAANIAFSTAGTGGFGIHNDSLASNTPYIQSVTTVFMVVFSINFNVFYLLLIREVKRAFHNEELWAFLGVVLVSTGIIAWNISSMYPTVREAIHHAAFQVSSIISTTGFMSADFDQWPELSKTLLLMLMLMGAMAGSTGGGLKSVRVVLMFKAARRAIHNAIHPNSDRLLHMDGELVEDSTVRSTMNYVSIYFILTLLSVLLVSVDGFSFEANFSAVVSCVNNVGPGLAEMGPTLNFSGYSVFSKIVLSLDMLLGRLELFPILILFTPAAWRK